MRKPKGHQSPSSHHLSDWSEGENIPPPLRQTRSSHLSDFIRLLNEAGTQTNGTFNNRTPNYPCQRSRASPTPASPPGRSINNPPVWTQRITQSLKPLQINYRSEMFSSNQQIIRLANTRGGLGVRVVVGSGRRPRPDTLFTYAQEGGGY